MGTIPRLNGIIRALESGGPAFATFCDPFPELARGLSTAPYDAVVFEGEHQPWDTATLRDCLQYLLNRATIAGSGSVAPAITPFARIPPNGGEMSQVFAKQALDIGMYGLIWPHISTVAQAYNAVAACRYPRPRSASTYEPAGIRGDGPRSAALYWGLSGAEYYARADVWPLAPQGEVFVILMIEDTLGIENLDDILANVPGIGAILIGEGDLSQELGHPRQYDHPEVVSAMAKIVDTCKRHQVIVGHPHVDEANAERVLAQGYRYLMAAPTQSYRNLEVAKAFAARQPALAEPSIR